MRSIPTVLPEYNGVGVYRITNKSNGRVYIGSAFRCRDRLRYHEREIRLRHGCNCKMREDGFDITQAEFEVLIKLPDDTTNKELGSLESSVIDEQKAIIEGYNTYSAYSRHGKKGVS